MNVTDNVTVDWDNIRWEYENVKISAAKIAKKYGVCPMSLSRRKKEEGWVKFSYKAAKEEKIKKEINEIECVEVSTVVNIPNPEGILGTVAKRKIEELLKELGDHYSNIDEPLIVVYAKSYQRYLEIEKLLDESGYLEVSEKGGVYTHPYFNMLQAAISNLTKTGDKLGASIAARKRMGISIGQKVEQKGFWDDLDNVSVSFDI